MSVRVHAHFSQLGSEVVQLTGDVPGRLNQPVWGGDHCFLALPAAFPRSDCSSEEWEAILPEVAGLSLSLMRFGSRDHSKTCSSRPGKDEAREFCDWGSQLSL
ncbi:UNVERIFIED_CONTAM: hypothetical protein K2H54_035453 [Gekko kuhli]